jgi:hypothetical protein
LFAGQQIGAGCPAPRQKVFVVAILAVAAFVIFRNLVAWLARNFGVQPSIIKSSSVAGWPASRWPQLTRG